MANDKQLNGFMSYLFEEKTNSLNAISKADIRFWFISFDRRLITQNIGRKDIELNVFVVHFAKTMSTNVWLSIEIDFFGFREYKE